MLWIVQDSKWQRQRVCVFSVWDLTAVRWPIATPPVWVCSSDDVLFTSSLKHQNFSHFFDPQHLSVCSRWRYVLVLAGLFVCVCYLAFSHQKPNIKLHYIPPVFTVVCKWIRDTSWRQIGYLPRPPTLIKPPEILHAVYCPGDSYIFHVSWKLVEGSRSCGDRKSPCSINLANGLYNSLYYRTGHSDVDTCLCHIASKGISSKCC